MAQDIEVKKARLDGTDCYQVAGKVVCPASEPRKDLASINLIRAEMAVVSTVYATVVQGEGETHFEVRVTTFRTEAWMEVYYGYTKLGAYEEVCTPRPEQAEIERLAAVAVCRYLSGPVTDQ